MTETTDTQSDERRGVIRWLIRETNYERIYEINQTLEERPNLSSHYLGVHGGEPQF